MKVYSEGSDGFEPLSSRSNELFAHWLIRSLVLIKIRLMKEWRLSGNFGACQSNDKFFVETRTYIRKFFLSSN